LERVLFRSIIIALLVKSDRNFVKPSLKEFMKEFSIEHVKKEVAVLKKAIEEENRITINISKAL